MKKRKILTYILLAIGVLLIALPLYLTILNAFKETRQITSHFFGWPDPFTLANFERLLNDGVTRYLINSLIVTVSSNALILLVIPMAAFAVSRKMQRSKAFQVLYFFLILGIFVPFQVIMIPMTNLMSRLGMANQFGLITLYVTFAIPQALFLYSGYVKSVIPKELDEAAAIDGCGKLRYYFQIVFPLMRPMHATVLILKSLWIWNDFLLPLLILNRDPRSWTFPLFQYNYQGQFFHDFGPSFAAYVVGIVSILIVYLFFQRHIISGMAQGSVK